MRNVIVFGTAETASVHKNRFSWAEDLNFSFGSSRFFAERDGHCRTDVFGGFLSVSNVYASTHITRVLSTILYLRRVRGYKQLCARQMDLIR